MSSESKKTRLSDPTEDYTFEDLRNGARARFDEFANRHPMFSTMRNQPAWEFDDPFGHHGFRERHNSGSSGAGSGASTASTGEERVIPIQIIRDDPPKPQQPQPQQQQQQQQPPQAPPRGKSPAPPTVIIGREKSPQPAASAGPQRCNTEPNNPSLLDDNRTTRAQSAPPVSPNGVPATKIPIETQDGKPQATQMGGNCSKTPKAEQAPSANSSGGVRSIPIIVEGRKTPVVNAMPNGNCQTEAPAPQPQPKVSRPAERSPTPPSKKPAPPKDPLAQVNAVMDEVRELEKQVDDLSCKSREDKEYLVLDEMFTRCLIKLDVVEAEGRDDVRAARKECIKYIQSCISKMEKKVPLQSEESMELGTPQQSQAETEKMDVASQSQQSPQNSSQSSNNDKKDDQSKMETDATNNCAKEGNKEGQSVGADGDQQPVKA